MAVIRLKENPLAQGFYTPSEAARLVEFSSSQKVYAWLNGWPRRKIGPVLVRQYPPINQIQELSFLDLMEVRFVKYFREHKVKWSTLHVAAQEARKELGTTHPFASDKLFTIDAKFTTDGKHIFLVEVLRKSAEQAQDRRAMDIITKQYQIYEAIQQSLVKGVEFDPRSHLAERWYPRPERFPEILIDPKIAHGRPATAYKGIPAEALYDAWCAEDEDVESVARWYEIPVREVRQAVNFHATVFHAVGSA